MSSETKSSATLEETDIETKIPVHYLFSFRSRDSQSCDCNNNGSPCYSCSPKITHSRIKHGLFIINKKADLLPLDEVIETIRERIPEASYQFKYCEVMIWNLHSRDPELKDDVEAYDLVIEGKKVKYNDYE